MAGIAHPLRTLLDRRRAVAERARFAAWTRWLGVLLRAHGARLVVEAGARPRLGGWPRVALVPYGRRGGATFTLRLGDDVRLGRDLALDLHAPGTNVLALGTRAELADGVRLELRDGTMALGERVRVRDHVVLKSEGLLELGERVEVSWFVVMHCANRLAVGARAGVAERVTLVDSEHVHDGTPAPYYGGPVRLGEVEVGANVFLAAGAVLTAGSRIGENSVVAAGSVVAGRAFPPSSLVAGVPARLVRPLAAGEDQRASSSA